MLIGLPRPPDFLEDQHQDQVFRLLGLQVMCPVLWMDLSWGNDCLHDFVGNHSQANRQNCEVLVLNLAGGVSRMGSTHLCICRGISRGLGCGTAIGVDTP